MCGHAYQAGNDPIDEESVVDDVVKCWTLLGVGGENLLCEFACVMEYCTVIFETLSETDVVWMFECAMILDFSIQLVDYE